MSEENKYCQRCGTQLPSNANFCPNCGVNVKAYISETLQPKVHRRRFIIHRSDFKITRNVRIAIFFFFMAVFIIGLILGTYAPMSVSDANTLTSSVQNEVNRSSFVSLVISIASNNIELCLIIFVPIFGQIFMALTSYTTGLVFSADAIAYSVNRINILQNLFFYPSTWLETVVYSLAASEGFIFLLSFIKGNYVKESKRLAITIMICVAVLILSAVIETLTG